MVHSGPLFVSPDVNALMHKLLPRRRSSEPSVLAAYHMMAQAKLWRSIANAYGVVSVGVYKERQLHPPLLSIRRVQQRQPQ
jgi:hypothetical protein